MANVDVDHSTELIKYPAVQLRKPSYGKQRDFRVQSVSTTHTSIDGCTSLLSEITSFETVKRAESMQFNNRSSLLPETKQQNSHDLNFSCGQLSSKKSVSFLWRVLGRAGPEYKANIHVVSIQAVHKTNSNDIEIRKGQQVKALYRIVDQVSVENASLECGFIPYSSCRLSRKHYGPQSMLMQLSYLQLYPQSPDGTDVLSNECSPVTTMVAVKDHFPSSHEEICAQRGEMFTALYCDAVWIYAVNTQHSGLLPRSVCILSRESQLAYKDWMRNEKPFQTDFIVKFNESRPQILEKNPFSITHTQKGPIKIGKIFTVIQNFVPDSPNSGTFTIRKGLRVKVMKESGQLVSVMTKKGSTFWIPSNYIRPARKSDSDRFISD